MRVWFEHIADLPPTDQNGRASCLAGKKEAQRCFLGAKNGIVMTKQELGDFALVAYTSAAAAVRGVAPTWTGLFASFSKHFSNILSSWGVGSFSGNDQTPICTFGNPQVKNKLELLLTRLDSEN
jgi:hypothetical protein